MRDMNHNVNQNNDINDKMIKKTVNDNNDTGTTTIRNEIYGKNNGKVKI